MKKLLSLILSISFLTSLIVVPAHAADFTTKNNKYMLMDFSSGMPEGVNIIHNGSTVAGTEAVYITETNAKGDTALAIDYTQDTSATAIEINFKDLGMNTNFSSLFGTEAATNKYGQYNLCIDYKTANGASGALAFYYTTVGTDINEKNAHNYNFENKSSDEYTTDTYINRSVDGSFASYTGRPTFEGFVVKPTGSADGTIYIDSIYLAPVDSSNQTMTVNPYQSGAKYTMVEFQNRQTLSNFTKGTEDTDHIRQFDKSLKVTKGVTASYAKSSQIDACPCLFSGAFGDDDPLINFNYVNMWVYSENTAVGDTFTLKLREQGGSKTYYNSVATNDWGSGYWKLVSVPFSTLGANPFVDSSKLAYNFREISFENASETGTMYFNHVWFSSENPADAKYEFSLVENDKLRYIDEPVEIEFTNPISEAYSTLEGAVTVTDADDNPVTGFTPSIDGNKLVLSFDNNLEYLTEYTVKINNKILDYDGKSLLTNKTTLIEDPNAEPAVYTFKTEDEPADIRIKGINFTNGYSEIENLPKVGNVAVSADVSGTGSAVLMLAVYSDDGKVLDEVIYDTADLSAGSDSLKVSLEQSFVGKTVKAFIWKNQTTDITPLKVNITK